MKSIRHGRVKRHDKDYRYFDIMTRTFKSVTKEELYGMAITLPVRVKSIFRKIELFKVPMTRDEENDALTLCSISIGCLKGSPRMDIDGVSMDDYTNDFYMQMVKCLKSWNPEKGPWPNYVKWVRLKTIKAIFSRLGEYRKGEAEARRFRSMESSSDITEPDFASLQELGLQGPGGKKVCTCVRNS